MLKKLIFNNEVVTFCCLIRQYDADNKNHSLKKNDIYSS